MDLKVKYLKHNEIDLKRWDDCIAHSRSKLIFPSSYFLNAMHPQWDAIIVNNYESVFPVISEKKHGVNYIYQPYFTQQLGLFGKFEENADVLDKCISEVHTKFKYMECNLSYLNTTEKYLGNCANQVSFKLDLDKSINELQQEYSKNLTRNLAKASKNNLRITNSVSSKRLIQLFKENKGKDLKHISENHYKKLTLLLTNMQKENAVELIGVNTDNKLIAAAAFSIFNNRLTFFFSGLNVAGRELFAMPFLINHIIEKNSETEKTLDFNGSNQESLARFYKSFGASEYVYLRLKLNALPWPFNLFKK